ncbi:electron transfer flavoprotein-ubiquinone oxidoreductase [Geminicoccus harenae]|uniref:electron transfer flavoprotein-ubiquinone oxidoreductase n=1 Tax=Geminicoccus harenae TaxID=2498453 RepID=UPI00168A9A0A|nr:electron transfer flavoprotein-ubiquinone oxidoreductase [Geminicoccus harenae]
MEREQMAYDVVIVGAGPAGLAAAIRLKQIDEELSVCVIEKGAEVGAHILSGAVLEPRSLNELLPDWQAQGAPVETAVTEDQFLLLTETGSRKLPTPPQMHNQGNYIISLGLLCRWLAEQAEGLGVEIYPGFAAAEVLYDEAGAVRGVATGDMGVGRDGQPTDAYQPGMELVGRLTLFAEGCRGSLTKTLFQRFNLRDGVDPQTYGIGIKELWEVDPAQFHLGRAVHSIGWPLDQKTYGGSFLYHWKDNQIAFGFVVGLDYANPYLSPFGELQRLKLHPAMRPVFEGGRRISYGSRAITEGGLQSLPKLVFPGGALIGDTAGFLNVPKIKGTHTAMKSAMLCAEAAAAALKAGGDSPILLDAYPEAFRKSWLYEELHGVRNIRPSFRRGLMAGLAYSALDTYVFKGKAPWTLHHHADHSATEPKAKHKPIDYPKPDGKLTFDRLSSVFLSGTNHEEDQPCHLQLKDPTVPTRINLPTYDAPEQRYCPAAVYEIVQGQDGEPRLQINAQNCVHCKTCDIKDPTQNINWVTPQGGGGPVYGTM